MIQDPVSVIPTTAIELVIQALKDGGKIDASFTLNQVYGIRRNGMLAAALILAAAYEATAVVDRGGECRLRAIEHVANYLEQKQASNEQSAHAPGPYDVGPYGQELSESEQLQRGYHRRSAVLDDAAGIVDFLIHNAKSISTELLEPFATGHAADPVLLAS